MTDPAPTDRIVAQGRALVRAIEALGTVEHTARLSGRWRRCSSRKCP